MSTPFSFLDLLELFEGGGDDPEIREILGRLRIAFDAGDGEQVGWETVKLMQANPLFKSGYASLISGKRAGEDKRKGYIERNLRLAREYLRRRAAAPTAGIADTALMEKIGREKEGLQRSAARAPIKAGLRLLEK